jgi:hypothetical protein
MPLSGNFLAQPFALHLHVCAKQPHKHVCAKQPHKHVCAKQPRKHVCAKQPHKHVCAKQPHKRSVARGLCAAILPLLLLLVVQPVTAQDTISFGGVYELPQAEVRATYIPVSPLAQRFTAEEVYRLPGTFYDPARLVGLLPSVVQTNDQANHLSVRGNSPNANLWRINGLAITNPNHTANAGTFFDYPTLNGGGVNAISAQMLNAGNFYSGGLPVEYGYASGGTFDLRLRPGNKSKAQHQIQAGFIGFDLATEGPIGKSGQTSYLINGRYSFTGLLADMGVDFGGEEIRFADVNAHLHHQWTTGELSVFGIFGNSTNDFTATDPAEAELEEQKELFNINYQNGVAVIGASFGQELGGGQLSGGIAFSETSPERTQGFRGESTPQVAFNSNSSITSSYLHWNRRLGENFALTIGAEFLQQEASTASDFNSREEGVVIEGIRTDFTSTAFTPLVGLRYEKNGFELAGGLRYNNFSGTGDGESNLDTRLKLAYRANNWRVVLSQDIIRRVNIVPRLLTFGGSGLGQQAEINYQYSLGVGRKIGKISTLLTGFYQTSNNVLAARDGDFLVSANNLLELNSNIDFNTTTSTRRYGVELEAGGGRKTKGWYYRGSITALRAETEQLDGEWTQDRFSADFIGKLTVGREWPGQDRKQRTRTFGLNLALIAHGGERFGEVEATNSAIEVLNYLAPQNFANGFVNSNGTYFRPDLRLYKTKVRTKTTTTLALDIQNVAGIENQANVYYDVFLGRPNERLQLGLIPVLSYRIVWR